MSTDCNYDQGVDVFLGDDQSSLDVTDIDDPESESLVIPAGTTAGIIFLFEADWTDSSIRGVNALQVTGTGGNPVTQCISAGGQHSLAVCSDNSARDWGWNLFGQLGNSNNNDSYTLFKSLV
ncbi:MAG: hypothetical protein IPL74_13580 [Bacteroidetes bacterium]|nr:hypothetical protein [Bacteroidota bacterium]